MINDPEFRKSLLISLATSVLVLLLIDPVLKIALKWVMWLGTHASDSWTNSIYQSAALGSTQKFSFMILAFAFAGIQGVTTGLVMVRFRTIKGEKIPRPRRALMTARVSMLAILPLTYLFGVAILASSFAELQLNTSFNQRLTVLAAKASDQEIKELRAAWALMEKQTDYAEINTRMQLMAKELDTKLPQSLW